MHLSKAAGQGPETIDRTLTLELARVTEVTAIAAAGWRCASRTSAPVSS